MKTKKKAIVCFLAVVMLLVVSIATASAYTVRPVQMVIEKEQISTTKPSSLGILGEATFNMHVEVADWANDPTEPLKGGYVSAVQLFIPFWLRFISQSSNVTDSNGNCQLKVSALPEWLDIPFYYRIWITDPESGKMGVATIDGIYAGKTYNLNCVIIRYPPSPVNNMAEQEVLQSLQNR